MHTIALTWTRSGWTAKHSDPEVVKLFGTDTLPTAFTDRADAATVLLEVARLNPEHRVMLA
jgi:hypothetical protein